VIKTAGRLRAALQDLGAAVALFEAGPVLIPAADASVSAEFSRAFRGQGVDVLTGTMVEALRRDGAGIQVDYRSGEQRGQLEAGAVFFAVGWPANLDALNLDVAGVATEPGWIPVDDYLRTNVGHIFAAGDVNGRSMLVQSARMEGRLAATNAILGPSRQASYDVVPSGSFTDPEYGRVGLTEAEAAQQHDVAVGIAYYNDLLRPVADGRSDGFCKLIADRREHTILGAHVLGEYSAETVQTVAACMAAGMTVEQVAELQLAFPTFTEGVSMAAQKICRSLGVGRFPQVWSYLGPED
jgi:pyruvate/2-oxoglutarate dehydrogenase complex dihydrolipoamide dehydrogenase (E3) component